MQKVHVFAFFPSKCPSHACQVSLLCFLCFHSGLCCLPRKRSRGRGCVRCLPGLGFGCGRGFIGSIQGKLFLGLLSTLLVQDEVRTVGSWCFSMSLLWVYSEACHGLRSSHLAGPPTLFPAWARTEAVHMPRAPTICEWSSLEGSKLAHNFDITINGILPKRPWIVLEMEHGNTYHINVRSIFITIQKSEGKYEKIMENMVSTVSFGSFP